MDHFVSLFIMSFANRGQSVPVGFELVIAALFCTAHTARRSPTVAVGRKCVPKLSGSMGTHLQANCEAKQTTQFVATPVNKQQREATFVWAEQETA